MPTVALVVPQRLARHQFIRDPFNLFNFFERIGLLGCLAGGFHGQPEKSAKSYCFAYNEGSNSHIASINDYACGIIAI